MTFTPDTGDILRIEAKSILSGVRKKDSWFGIAYNMNLYRGCQHGCIYCDTRSECYGIGDISRISVKSNALPLLRKELKSRRKSKDTVGTGSMNDPYMPLEATTGLVRSALTILSEEKFPVHIITKSDLVLRDMDLLEEISNVYAAVSFTITTANDQLAGKIEPHAPSTSARFKALEKLAAKGIYTGICLMPVLPYINDTPENITEIVKRAAGCGASYILPMFGTTMRKGSRDYFYQALDREFPGLSDRYMQQFGEKYECFSPDYYRLKDLFTEATRERSISSCMRFYEPPADTQLSLF